jgi:hypothetical protein
MRISQTSQQAPSRHSRCVCHWSSTPQLERVSRRRRGPRLSAHWKGTESSQPRPRISHPRSRQECKQPCSHSSLRMPQQCRKTSAKKRLWPRLNESTGSGENQGGWVGKTKQSTMSERCRASCATLNRSKQRSLDRQPTSRISDFLIMRQQ